jgi:acyl carrier protein
MRPRLLTLLSDVLQRDDLPPFEECSIECIGEWDSIVHLNLILSVEGEFGITFPMEMIVEIDSLEAIERALREQGLQ